MVPKLMRDFIMLENRFREALPFKLTIYVEPDVYDPTLQADDPTPPAEPNPS